MKHSFLVDQYNHLKQFISMKKALLISFLIIFSFPLIAKTDSALRRSNGLLRFIAESRGLRDFALGSVIGTRCSTYLPSEKKRPCKAAVKKMIAILDYDVIFSDDKTPPVGRPQPDETWTPSSFVFVAFKQNLIALLSQPKTAQYLNDLNQQLYKYLTSEKSKLNVWDVTKAHYASDYSAAMVIATLFQDTSVMKLHLAYLERARTPGNVSFQSNKELLSRVIDTINLILDASEESYRELFYPEEIQKDLNRNIYHFYVPLYLAKALEKTGSTKEDAYNASLMLNLAYEFVTQSKDYRYLYMDPETITAAHTIKDIYGGYCGSNIGVRGMNFTKNFESVRATFERSVTDAVEMLIRH